MNQDSTQCLGYKLSSNPETEGFDLQAGQTWIYPTNYPIRDYQFNIIQKALLKNTLVSLPTGLGKTFIAAVVMYNFFRWYPMGKVIFMAPTRPLVKQQIDACYDIMAIPKDVTAELTGSKVANCREDIWNDKRVFFITPQILQNDLDKVTGLGSKIKCIVFDEAHRARGNHAYCEVIRKLIPHNKFFRVLALSATPGSNIGDVLEVVQNLLISHLEFRTEESLDVHPYIYERNLTTIVVPLGNMLQKVKDDYLQILEYYTRTLVKYKIIQGNCGNLTKGKIFLTMKEFQQKTRNNGSSNYAEIMKSLNICITLYHGFELLIRHGLRSFLSFFSEHIDKPLMRGNTRLMEIMNDIRDYLGPEPNIEQLPDGSYPEIPETTKFGHPKFYKLRDILLSHFIEASESSRVIVFFEYRNSVMEAYALLFQARPILKPRIFLGQGHGVTQRVQLNVVKSFREGDCNILLSTCIGEEGLDVGDVDLIVCFDISNKSPIRMVQRMGRTGRKKRGNIIVLVTEGKEQQVLKDCLIHKNNIACHVLSSRELATGLNYSSPRLVPTEITPKCEKIYITVKKTQLTKNSSLKEMFRNISSSSSEPTFSPDLQIVDIQEKIPKSQMLWNKVNPLDKEFAVSNIFSKRIEKQRNLQPIHLVKHSEGSEILVNLLQLIDSKRFNIPISQIGSSSQLTQNRNLKQCDIRNMFLKPNDILSGTQDQEIPPIRNVQEEESHLFDSKGLITEISNYLSIQMLIVNKRCKHCPNTIDCSMNNIVLQYTPFNWNQVDDSILDSITTEDLNYFSQSLDPNSEETCDEFEFKDFDVFHNLKITQLENINKLNNSSDLDSKQYFTNEDVDTDIPLGEKSVAYQAPKTLDSLLTKYSTSIIDIEEISQKEAKKNNDKRNPNILDNSEKLNDEHKSEILHFFKFNSLAELFSHENINDSQETVVYSPDIFDGTIMKENESVSTEYKKDNHKKSEDELSSPVLCTFERVRNVKHFQKNIFNESFKEDTCREQLINISKLIATPTRPNLRNLYKRKEMNNEVDTPSKFTMNVTKLSSTPIEKIGEKRILTTYEKSNSNYAVNENSFNMLNLHPKMDTEEKHLQADELDGTNEKNIENNLDVDDLCDLSIFGVSSKNENNVFKTQTSNKENQINNKNFSEVTPLSSFDVDEFCDLTTFGMVSQENNKDKTVHKKTEYVTAIDDSKTTCSKNIITKLDTLVGKQDNSEIDNIENNNIDEIIIVSPSSTKENYCMPLNKSYCQSQLPITQILSLINKDEKKIPKNVQMTTSQRNNFELNANYENCSHSNKGKDLLIKDTFYNTDMSPNTAKLSLRTNQVKEKQSPKTISLNESFSSTNSDDDFQETQTHVYKKQNAQINNKNRNSQLRTGKPSSLKSVKKTKNCNVFIDDEAELSLEEDVNISEDEEDQDQDMYEISFIADETQNVDTQMHARYLQSVKSPRKGQFKIPPRKSFVGNVYSQEVNHEDDTYLDDTFVVHEETESPQFELSELEILEQKLKEIKRNKRKKPESITKPIKRRRIIHISSDDSD